MKNVKVNWHQSCSFWRGCLKVRYPPPPKKKCCITFKLQKRNRHSSMTHMSNISPHPQNFFNLSREIAPHHLPVPPTVILVLNFLSRRRKEFCYYNLHWILLKFLSLFNIDFLIGFVNLIATDDSIIFWSWICL